MILLKSMMITKLTNVKQSHETNIQFNVSVDA